MDQSLLGPMPKYSIDKRINGWKVQEYQAKGLQKCLDFLWHPLKRIVIATIVLGKWTGFERNDDRTYINSLSEYQE